MKIDKLTKFAITLGLLPWVPAFILYKHGLNSFAYYVIGIFIFLSLISFISKSFASIFKKIIDKIGAFLGKYLAAFVLLIVYIIAILPTGLLMKLVKRDRLLLKKPILKTYWKKFENNNTDYEYQF